VFDDHNGAVNTPAMPVRMVQTLDDLRFVQAVFDVRYPRAHKYWDSSGAIIETIEQRLHGLKCVTLDQQGFRFTGTAERGLTAAQFYWEKTTATVGDPATNLFPRNFIQGASEFVRLVGQHLSVQALSFVGNRFWYIVPFSERSEAEAWLSSLSLWGFWGSDERLGTIENDGVRLRTRIDDRVAVVRLGSGEASKPGGNIIGVIVDVDLQLTKPPVMSRLDGESTIKGNLRLLEQFLAAFFNQGSPK
jgi:hypothetical protein